MAAVVQRHIEIVERRDLADSGTGVAHPNLTHRIPAAGNGFPVFYENRAEGHGEENVVVAHEVSDALGRVLRAQPLIQEIPGGSHKERIHAIVERIALGVVIGVEAVELAVPGQDTKVAVTVIIRVHRDDGVGLVSHDRGEVLVVRAEGVVGKLPSKLGGVGDFDFGKAAALSVDLFFPENRQDGIVKIILNIPGVKTAVEVGIWVKGDRLIRGQQTGGSGLLNDIENLCRAVQTDGSVAGGIGLGT